MSRDLHDLAVTFLRGTARSAVPSPSPGPLGKALQAAERATPEETLLARAALSGLYLQAGQVPAQVQTPAPVFVPTEAEDRPPVPPALGPLLEGLTEHPALLYHTLGLLVAAGYTLPAPDALPLLALTDGGTDGLSGPLWTLLDEHGRWLARLNPGWIRHDPATPSDSLRVTRLRRELVEAHAADPEGCVAGLLPRWPALKADERRVALNAVAAGPHPADWPLLELAMNDKLPDLRRWARLLRGHLPGEVRDAVQAALPTWFRREKGQLKGGSGVSVDALGEPDPKDPADSELSRLLGASRAADLPALLNLSLNELLDALKKHPGHVGSPASQARSRRALEELERASGSGLSLPDLEALRLATPLTSLAFWPRVRLEDRLWEATDKLLRVRQENHALAYLVQSLMSALPGLPDRAEEQQPTTPPKGLLARLVSVLKPSGTGRDWPRRWEDLALWLQGELGREIQPYGSPLPDLLDRVALALDLARPDPLVPEPEAPTDLPGGASTQQQEGHDRAVALHRQQVRTRAALTQTLALRRRVQAALSEAP